MSNKTSKQLKALGLRIIIISGFLLSWEAFTTLGLVDSFYTSKPSDIYRDLKDFYSSGALMKHTLVTLQEATWGLFFGTIIGMSVGFLLGLVKVLGRIFEPIITALYGIPKLALAPIFILWFGLGIKSKIVLSSLLVFYLVFFSTYAGVKSVDHSLISSVKLMGANKLQILFKVVLPSSVPWILSGIRGGLGASLIGAIVGEYMGASAGLGWMISYATSFFQIQRVMSCIFILLIIGITFNLCLKLAESRLLRWRPNVGLNNNSEESI